MISKDDASAEYRETNEASFLPEAQCSKKVPGRCEEHHTSPVCHIALLFWGILQERLALINRRQPGQVEGGRDQVKEYCAKVVQKLDSFSLEDERLALKALQVKVVVGKAGVRLFGLIPDSNATTGQTWA